MAGEHVRVAVTCQAMLSLGSHVVMGVAAGATMRQFHIGATGSDPVLVDLDLMGKPAEVRKRPLGDVGLLESKEGFLSDVLVIAVGDPNPLRVQVPRMLREGTRQLVRILSS